jgi:hypothetical protein
VAAAAARRTGHQTAPDTPPTVATRVAEDGSLRVGPRQLETIMAALYDASVCAMTTTVARQPSPQRTGEFGDG